MLEKVQNTTLLQRTGNMPDKRRMLLLSVAAFIVAINSTVPLRFVINNNIDTIVGYLMILISVLCMYRGKIEIQKKAVPIIILVSALGIIAIITGLGFRTAGYIAYGICIITMVVGMSAVVYRREQIELLIRSCSIGICISFIVFAVISILMYPLRDEQYASFTGNPNTVAYYATIAFTSAMYMSIKSKGFRRVAFCIIQGIALAFIIFSRARTSLLVVAASIILIVAYILINKISRRRFKEILIFGAIIIATVYISYCAMAYVSTTVGLNEGTVKDGFEKHFRAYIPEDGENINGESMMDFKQLMKASSKRSLKGIGDGDSFLSGRLFIWNYFISESGIIGHKEGTITLKFASMEHAYTAHNGFIQVCYNYGYVAGVVYVLIALYMVVVMLKQFVQSIKHRTLSIEHCCIFVTYAGFFLYSILEATVTPMAYYYVYMTFIFVIPATANRIFSYQDKDK